MKRVTVVVDGKQEDFAEHPNDICPVHKMPLLVHSSNMWKDLCPVCDRGEMDQLISMLGDAVQIPEASAVSMPITGNHPGPNDDPPPKEPIIDMSKY